MPPRHHAIDSQIADSNSETKGRINKSVRVVNQSAGNRSDGDHLREAAHDCDDDSAGAYVSDHTSSGARNPNNQPRAHKYTHPHCA